MLIALENGGISTCAYPMQWFQDLKIEKSFVGPPPYLKVQHLPRRGPMPSHTIIIAGGEEEIRDQKGNP
jgi:hypothetical protein